MCPENSPSTLGISVERSTWKNIDVHLRETLLVPLWERLGDGMQVRIRPRKQDTTDSNLVLLVSCHTSTRIR